MTEQDDIERLEILAAWHRERAAELGKIKHRHPWNRDRDHALIAHHTDADNLLSRLALEWRAGAIVRF